MRSCRGFPLKTAGKGTQELDWGIREKPAGAGSETVLSIMSQGSIASFFLKKPAAPAAEVHATGEANGRSASAKESEASLHDVVDLTDDDQLQRGPEFAASKRRCLHAAPLSSSKNHGVKPPTKATGITYLKLPGGVLDDSILARVDAIVQQLNCVGCDGRGLAEGVRSKLPYGCSYAGRRRMPPQNKFAVPEDRATLGEFPWQPNMPCSCE